MYAHSPQHLSEWAELIGAELPDEYAENEHKHGHEYDHRECERKHKRSRSHSSRGRQANRP